MEELVWYKTVSLDGVRGLDAREATAEARSIADSRGNAAFELTDWAEAENAAMLFALIADIALEVVYREKESAPAFLVGSRLDERVVIRPFSVIAASPWVEEEISAIAAEEADDRNTTVELDLRGSLSHEPSPAQIKDFLSLLYKINSRKESVSLLSGENLLPLFYAVWRFRGKARSLVVNDVKIW